MENSRSGAERFRMSWKAAGNDDFKMEYLHVQQRA